MLKLNITYFIHTLLHSKYRILIHLLLIFTLYAIMFNTTYISCMTNDNDALSTNSDEIQSISELSSIFEYDKIYMNDMVQQGIEHLTSTCYRNVSTEAIEPIDEAIAPLFESYKLMNPRLDAISLDSTPTVEKIKMLEQTFFDKLAENVVLDKALEDQTSQLIRRHNSLLEAKGAIKELTQENLELKNQVDELERLLRENLRK